MPNVQNVVQYTGKLPLFETMALPHAQPAPLTPPDSPPAGRLCSRIEALQKELRLGLGKELFAKAYSVLEGGLDTENEGVGVAGGALVTSLTNLTSIGSSCCTTLHTRCACCTVCMWCIHTDMCT